jgi:ornithine decarboxylase
MPMLDVGDWVYFQNMGAYTLAAGSTFNGMPRPKVFYFMEDAQFELVQMVGQETVQMAS